MNVDENVFFREATLRICSSLDIVTALKRCFEFIRAFIPADGMTLHRLDPDLNLLKFVASVGLYQVNERVLPLPEKGRDKRAADLQAAFLTDEGKVLILHPDKEAGLPEILEQLGINANISLMNLFLQLEGNQIGTLALYADGLNQYTGEHARLLQLLHGPFAIAMSKALEHQETIERTAELRRSEAYLAETQRLSHTGNWVWNPIHPEFLYASEEMLRLYGFDPQKGIPTPAQVLERIHPDDRDKIKMTRTGKADVDFDYKFVLPDGTLKHFHCIAHPVLGPSGETHKVVGIAMDITDRKRAEEERLARVWFLESMDRINRAMQGTNDIEQVMRDVLDAMLSIFECDRAFLVYPCDPDAPSFEAIMECTRPGYPARRGVIPAAPDTARHFQLYLASSGAVTLGPGCDYPLEISRFGEKSKMMNALYPKTGKPWVLGMHQCSYPRVWSEGEKNLLEEIARRITDVLTGLLAHRSLRESEKALRQGEAYLAEAQRLSHTGSWAFDLASNKYVYASEECLRIFGTDAQEDLPNREAVSRLIHPEDWDSVQESFEKSLREKVDTSSEFRIVLPSGTAKHVQAIRHPVLNDSGDVVQFVGTTVDITERKRAEEALRLASDYNRSLIEASLDPFVTIDKEGKISDVNASTEQVTGYTRPELIGTDFSDYFTEPERARAGYQQVFHQGFVRDYELEIRNRNGEITPVLYNASVYRDDTGNVIGVFAAARDITKQKRAEEARSRLAAIVESSDDAIISEDLDGTFTSWNQGAERLYGYSAAEALGRPLSILLSPDHQHQPLLLKQIREGISIKHYETERVKKDGRRINVSLTISPVRNHHGEIIGASAISRDITERNKAEAEINSLKNYLSNIIDSMPSILVGMDNNRTVTQWNRQAEAFTGIPAGEAIGKPIVHLLPDFAPWIMTMGTDMDEHRPSSMEKLLIEKEGERRFYDLMLYPLFIQAVGGAVLRVEDVTERARIQELMVQTEKMMSIGGLAAGMAHEINNPLGIITQAAQNIERRISLELPANREVSEELGLNLERIRAYFEKRQIPDAIASIRTASSRAAKIVANMLQFSRRADTTMVFTSLAQIVDQALELAASDYDLKKKYDFRSIEIIKDYQDTPQVPIVALEIEQVILNLLSNAAQAMIANPPDRRPSITFRLRCEDRYAVLEVEDNGPSMTEDVRRRIFEPFFTTKEPGVGTGLGLSVSYMIVTQNHKGLMEVQSIPGRGTLFMVRLPIGENNHE